MSSYQKILLCYDGSREGRKALRCGADLARDMNAEAHILAVVNMHSSIAQSGGMLTDTACRKFEDAAREVLQEGVDKLAARGLTAHGHFAFGDPAEEISALASSLSADLVVIGHRPRTGLARWWAGSGNTALLDRLNCSILVTVCHANEVEPESMFPEALVA